jgi:XTP/dITP diphosphohydrolase
MKRVLYLATANRHKTREISAMLAGMNFDARDLSHCPDYIPPEESGRTFLENARIKARALRDHVTKERLAPAFVLADDSGLSCDALSGAPGVHSARFAGAKASDAENNAKLTALLRNVPESGRTARYVCALVLIGPDGEETEVVGTCEGRIILDPRGNGGFGYDPYFYLDEFGKTMAELPPEEKNRISHRGQAFAQLLMRLPSA